MEYRFALPALGPTMYTLLVLINQPYFIVFVIHTCTCSVVATSQMSVGNQQKLSSAASGILDMTNKMFLLRTFLALFLAGFYCSSNATDTNGKSTSIFDVLYVLLR